MSNYFESRPIDQKLVTTAIFSSDGHSGQQSGTG